MLVYPSPLVFPVSQPQISAKADSRLPFQFRDGRSEPFNVANAPDLFLRILTTLDPTKLKRWMVLHDCHLRHGTLTYPSLRVLSSLPLS